MFARYVRFIALGSVTLAVAGCRISSFSMSAYDDDHHYRGRSHVTRVYTDAGHICTHDCHDHYWNGSRVVVLSGGHRHGPGCGHHWGGKRWVVMSKHGHGHSKVKVKHGRGHSKVKVNHGHGHSEVRVKKVKRWHD